MGQEMLEDPEGGPEKGKEPPPLDAQDIAILKHYGKGLYFDAVKRLETDCKDLVKQVRAPPQVNDKTGVRESDTGLAHPAHWDLVSDKQAMQEEQPLQVRAPQPPAPP